MWAEWEGVGQRLGTQEHPSGWTTSGSPPDLSPEPLPRSSGLRVCFRDSCCITNDPKFKEQALIAHICLDPNSRNCPVGGVLSSAGESHSGTP